jgi:DNA-binding LacI/PurR family transcriptional regulator
MSDMKKNVTIADLAQKLSYSKATISYVLSGRAKDFKIPDNTVKKVREVARKLNYIPNKMARNLSKQSSGTVSLLLGNLVGSWAHHLVEGVSPLVQEKGYDMFIGIHNWQLESELKELERIATRRDEGIICQPVKLHGKGYSQISSSSIPMVLLDAVDDESVNYVAWDSAPAAKKVNEHLVSSGRRKIGFVGVSHTTITTKHRFEAYKSVLKEAGLNYREDYVFWIDQHAEKKESYEQLIKKVKSHDAPDALFVLNDGIAYSVLKAFYEEGVRVPDDISVAGMGDLDMSADFAVGLTTVREPIETIGREAINLLFSIINGEVKKPVKKWISCDELIVRRTT